MHIIADVNKISKTVQRNLTFILNVLSESSIHFTQLSIVLDQKNVLMQLFPLKRLVFVVHFLNAFWHGKETFPKSNSQNEIVPLLIVFHLPYSKYKGVKICFYLCRYQNQNFSLVLHSCHSCSTRVALVSHSCRQCSTCVALLLLVLLVSGTRVVSQTRSLRSSLF